MAEEGQVIACHTVDTWKEHFEKGKGSQKLVFASIFEPKYVFVRILLVWPLKSTCVFFSFLLYVIFCGKVRPVFYL